MDAGTGDAENDRERWLQPTVAQLQRLEVRRDQERFRRGWEVGSGFEAIARIRAADR